jgi:hypothetical protein
MGKNNDSQFKEKEDGKNKIKKIKKDPPKPNLKEGYVFFTSRPPEYYIQSKKNDKKKKTGKSLNTSQISRIKERSQQDSSMSNEENDSNNENEIEKTEESYSNLI